MISAFIQQITPNANKAVLTGLVKFVDMIGQVRYSYKKDKTEKSYEDNEEYQRRVDDNRLKEISNFIERSVLSNAKSITSPIFPTSIILAVDNEWIDFENAAIGQPIKIDKIPDKTLIVDGQHRYFGMLKLYNKIMESSQFSYDGARVIREYLEKYYFNCTLLVNYDIWEQAQVFASVNFNQKKVNKSLFYDIYGINLPDSNSVVIPMQNEIYIAHQLVKYLDSSDKSPFKGFVKMLGKGKGFVSQAFVVECLLKHLSISGIWNKEVQTLLDTGKFGNLPVYELTAYLSSIKYTFKEYWPETVEERPKSLLCKTTGVGAIMQFLADIHDSLPSDLIEKARIEGGVFHYAELFAAFNSRIQPLRPFGGQFFAITTDSKYAGGAGKGMQKKLYDAIVEKWKEVM